MLTYTPEKYLDLGIKVSAVGIHIYNFGNNSDFSIT